MHRAVLLRLTSCTSLCAYLVVVKARLVDLLTGSSTRKGMVEASLLATVMYGGWRADVDGSGAHIKQTPYRTLGTAWLPCNSATFPRMHGNPSVACC
jgi:hypothetical protein